MVRLAASFVALASVLSVAPAFAGDRALIDFIGYSPDAKYFAFEEFGVQDGSGFPYSNIYIVDLESDQWVGESPYRVLLQDDGATVEEARNEAHSEADGAINEFTANQPYNILALNGDGDARTGAGEAIDFGQPGYGLSEMPASQTLGLGVFPRPPSEDCAIIDNATFGFSLAIDGEEIYADGQKLPVSRGCPMGYKIYAVLQPAEWSMTQGGTLAVISYYPFGFEGPDRRFLVVPLGQ
jgi:predicted secreted protein